MNLKRTLFSLLVICSIAAPSAADWTAGVTAFKAGDLAVAETEFRAMVESRPDWSGGHMMLGQTLLRDGRFTEALDPLKRAYELTPGDVSTVMALGQAYFKLDRFTDAADVMATTDPSALPGAQKVTFYKARALALSRSDRGREAIRDLEKAVALAPEDVELRRQLAYVAKSAGRNDLAITHFSRVVEVDPEDEKALRSLAQLLYDRALDAGESERAGLCHDVIPYAKRLVDLEERYEHLVLLGELGRCVDDLEVARDVLAIAAAQRPYDWHAQYRHGRAEIATSDWTAARTAFEDALKTVERDEDEAEVRKYLGYALERQEQLDKALEQYRLAGDTEGFDRVARNIEAKQEEEMLHALAEEKARLERELAELERSSGF